MQDLLTKNSEAMSTVVETFVIEETAELIYDGEALENWSNLIQELGLKGQTQIVKPEKSPIPFMHMKKGLVETMKILCPRQVKVEEYAVTPIPLEILKLIALSKKDSYFEVIQVWYDDKSPDPCVVGINYAYYSTVDGRWDKRFNSKEEAQDYMTKQGYSGSPYKAWDGEHYLLGKWADVKQSFEELKERAVKRYIEEQGVSLRMTLKNTQRELDDLEANAVIKFS